LLKKAKKQGGIAGVVMKTANPSVICKHFNAVKIGICGLHYHPSDPLLSLGFFSDPHSLFENFIFLTFYINIAYRFNCSFTWF